MKRHLKTITVPKTWPIKRKGQTFIIRPLPSKKLDYSLPIALVFKNMLKFCKTNKEVKTILRDKEILVDGKRKKNIKDLIGFMDVLSIPISNENYRMLLDKYNKLTLVPIDNKEAGYKIVKIISKKILKKGKVQLNLFDSKNIIVEKDIYKVSDSVKINISNQEILDYYKLEKGFYVFIISGKHAGEHGLINNIINKDYYVKTQNEEFIVEKSSLYVIGKDKSDIKLP